MRGWVRDCFDRWSADRGRAALRAGTVAPAIAVLAFHNVVPDHVTVPALDSSLHIRLSRFLALIDAIVALPHVRFPAWSSLPDPTVALDVHVTFDDAYRGAVQHALPALAARGIEATVFVAPALLGAEQPWWDHVAARCAERRESWWRERERLLRPPVAGVSAHVAQLFGSPPPLASEFQIATLEELRAAPGTVHFGCHSFTHACLPSLDDDALVLDLQASAAWLHESGLPTINVHAYPYGRFSPREEAALRRMGYRAAFRVDGGPYRSDTATGFSLPRVNIPAGMTPNGLIRRLVGPLA